MTPLASSRVYIFKDSEVINVNKGVWANIMPSLAAEKDYIRFKTFIKPGIENIGTCVQVTFDNLDKAPHWGGLVVPVKQDYWGKEPDLKAGLDLSKSKRLVFWLKGENGNEQVQIKAAITNSQEYGDSAEIPLATDWLTLTKEWTKYEIEIKDGEQLKRVITPFVIIANEAHNDSGKVVIYVDEIYYEF